MYLNGTSDVNVPHASLPAIGSGDFTLEAWIYPTNVTGFHAVFGKGYPLGYWFGMYNGKLRFYRGSTVVCRRHDRHSAQSLDAHRRQFLLRSFRQRLFRPSSYINGDSDGFYLHNGAAAVGGTYDLHIGSDQNVEYFVGDIAEARLWSGARGAESMRMGMHHAINEKRPGLIANWHLAGDFKDSINGHRWHARRIARLRRLSRRPRSRVSPDRSLLQHPAASHLRRRHGFRAEAESRHSGGRLSRGCAQHGDHVRRCGLAA